MSRHKALQGQLYHLSVSPGTTLPVVALQRSELTPRLRTPQRRRTWTKHRALARSSRWLIRLSLLIRNKGTLIARLRELRLVFLLPCVHDPYHPSYNLYDPYIKCLACCRQRWNLDRIRSEECQPLVLIGFFLPVASGNKLFPAAECAFYGEMMWRITIIA